MVVMETEKVEAFVEAICDMAPSHREATCDFVKDVLKQLKVEEYCRRKTQEKSEDLERALDDLMAKSSTEDIYEDEEENVEA